MMNDGERVIAGKTALLLTVMFLFCGCGDKGEKSGHQRLSDLVPIKVVVSDVASIDEGGVTALYRISGSAFLKVPVGSVLQQPGKADDGIILKNVPMPAIDERSIRFDGVEQLDAGRSCFTTVATAGEAHHRLFAEAHDAIKETAAAPGMVNEAQIATRQILDGFYKAQGKTLEGIEWREDGK